VAGMAGGAGDAGGAARGPGVSRSHAKPVTCAVAPSVFEQREPSASVEGTMARLPCRTTTVIAGVLAGLLMLGTAVFPGRTAACIGESVLWSPDLPVDTALTASVVSGPDKHAEWHIRVIHDFRGDTPSAFRLRSSGLCNIRYDLFLVPGQEFFLLSYGGGVGPPDRIETGQALIWLLDDRGHVTGELNVNSDEPGEVPHFRTLTAILAGLGLPNTATEPPSSGQISQLGALLLALALILFLRRRRSARHARHARTAGNAGAGMAGGPVMRVVRRWVRSFGQPGGLAPTREAWAEPAAGTAPVRPRPSLFRAH
jgi:MYXO-CTERM domain-containing protein